MTCFLDCVGIGITDPSVKKEKRAYLPDSGGVLEAEGEQAQEEAT